MPKLMHHMQPLLQDTFAKNDGKTVKTNIKTSQHRMWSQSIFNVFVFSRLSVQNEGN